MHTSAPTHTDMLLEYTGTLLHQAEARTDLLDADGHAVPVLCLDLALDNPLHTPLRVKQYFPTGAHAQAHAAAHRYKAGQRITVQVPLLSLRMGGIAAHIHLDKTPDTTPHDKEPA